MSARPAVDVVVPFAGSEERLRAVAARLAALELRDGDTVTLVDNRAAGEPVDGPAGVRVLAARGQQSSYFARNRGAEAGSAEWLLFLDGDVEFAPGLLDALLLPVPGERVGVLAGAIEDVVVVDGPVARWLRERGAMSQDNTLRGPRPYAQTAHCAVRRTAFAQVGGFTEGIRSGGDADLCFRLADAGWALEARPASVRHEARARPGALLRQMARHGAGAAWLEREHPGTFPRTERSLGLAWWLVRSTARVRGRESAARELLGPATALAFALGRRLPNTVGRSRRLDQLLR